MVSTLLGIIASGICAIVLIMVRDHFKLAEVAKDLHELVYTKDQEHMEFKERLTYLERRELSQRRRED